VFEFPETHEEGRNKAGNRAWEGFQVAIQAFFGYMETCPTLSTGEYATRLDD
jgi:hypothetical protein